MFTILVSIRKVITYCQPHPETPSMKCLLLLSCKPECRCGGERLRESINNTLLSCLSLEPIGTEAQEPDR